MIPQLFWSSEYFSLFSKVGTSRLVFDGLKWLASKNCIDEKNFPIITLFSDDIITKSPSHAPFGGIYFPKDYPIAEELLVEELQKYLLEKNLYLINIYLEAEYFKEKNSIPISYYIEKGFAIEYTNINHHIRISDWNPSLLSKGNRKKLKQSQDLKFHFSYANDEEIINAYNLIRANRQSHGVEVSLSLHELSLLLKTFPDNYFCHTVKARNGEIVAAAFLVATSEENLYVYLWADSPKYRSTSPIVFLMEKLIENYLGKFTYLDLGTSTIQGRAMEGLVRFKENLGAESSPKSSITWKMVDRKY